MELKDKQKEILQVAIELFKEKGFVAASMRDLAAKLNIKAASLYAHIKSKDELLEWICFGIADDFFEGLRTAQQAELSAEKKLDFFMEKHLETVLKNPEVTNIYTNEWKHLTTSLGRFIALRKQYQLEVENLLEAIFTAMDQPLDSKRFTTRFLLHTLNNSYYWYKQGEKSKEERIAEIKEKVCYGLLGKA